MEEQQWWKEILKNHRGKVLGAGAGLVIGLMIMKFGLFWSLFILVCVTVGFLVGRRLDETKEDFVELLEKYLPPGEHGRR